MRFLRKRYKDPMTGKDFKLLHFGEAKMAMNGMGGGVIPGANTLGPNGSLTNNSGLRSPRHSAGLAALGANSNSVWSEFAKRQSDANADATAQPDSDSAQPGSPSSPATTSANQPAAGSTTGNSGDKLSNTTFGGPPIVGVASISKNPTIREFDKKKKYNEWQFVYDPTMDRGLLITTPYQQQQAGFGMQATPNLNGQINGPNGTQNNNGFGNTFGSSPSPMQNNPTPNNGGSREPESDQQSARPEVAPSHPKRKRPHLHDEAFSNFPELGVTR